MKLLTLPVELQQKIIDDVYPGDIVALSSSCKQFHILCHDRLKEHKDLSQLILKRELTIFPANVRSPASDEAFMLGAPRLLIGVAQHPRLEWYLEELASSNSFTYMEENKVPLKSALHLVMQCVRQSPIIEDGEVQDWFEAIANGRGGAALALLLTRLTQLQAIHLDIRNKDSITPYVWRAISRLAARSRRGLLAQGLSALEDARLEFIYGNDREESDDSDPEDGDADNTENDEETVNILAALVRLPSFRNLSLRDFAAQDSDIGRNDADDPDYFLPSANSYLRSLTIDRGNISGSVLTRIIENCTSFEEFTYNVFHTESVFGRRWQNVPEVHPLPDFTIESICAILLKYARSSLRRLHIEIMEYGAMCGCRHEPCLNPYKPYLSINPSAPRTTNWKWNEFTALERLTLDIDLFSNAEEGGWLPFAETLPASIRDVTILAYRCPPSTDTIDFDNMFRGFKPQAYPNLQSISAYHRNVRNFYKLGHNGPSHILSIYRLALERAGISADAMREYKLDKEYFVQRRTSRQLPRQRVVMNEFGMADYNLYALPVKDLEGTVVFGVYHSEGSSAVNWSEMYDGIAVDKSWNS